jgi:hypothetical protein
MGLLDDAIREHLELKRRRGADPTEVEREEAEALGPARREGVEATDALDGPEADHADDGDEYAPEAYDGEPPHREPYVEPEDERATPPHGDPLLQQPTREFSSDELNEALTEHEREPDPAPEPEPGPPAGPSEDVLEETPDFLQETPEHDRLWFEQKPPKDFDF